MVVGAQSEARRWATAGSAPSTCCSPSSADEGAGPGRRAARVSGSTPTGSVGRCWSSGADVDDGTALRDLGIDLDAVRRAVEERCGWARWTQDRRWDAWQPRRPSQAGPARPPSARRAKRRRRDARGTSRSPRGPRSRRAALREALATQSREIRAGHLVLGLMREHGLAAGGVVTGGRPPGVRPGGRATTYARRPGRAALAPGTSKLA